MKQVKREGKSFLRKASLANRYHSRIIRTQQSQKPFDCFKKDEKDQVRANIKMAIQQQIENITK